MTTNDTAPSHARPDEVRTALADAVRHLPDGRSRSILSPLVTGERALTVGEAADLLGVRSPNTIKNWLEGGAFPGAYKSRGGHWRFLLADVLSVKATMDTASIGTRPLKPRVVRTHDHSGDPVF